MSSKNGKPGKPKPRPARSRRADRKPRPLWRRVTGWLVLFLAGVGLMLVLGLVVLRFAGPPATPLMAIRALEGAQVRHVPVALEDISPHLVRAVIAAEDTKFCSHHGFDVEAIQDALAEARAGKRQRGASTISQQTAKNVFLWPGGGWVRKGAEAGFTVLIETGWSKRRTMEVYLNIAEWGDGLFGAEAAARARFGKSARDLTPREAALLAAVLPSPNRWQANPPGPYVSRRAGVIERRMRIVRRDGLDGCVLGPG